MQRSNSVHYTVIYIFCLANPMQFLYSGVHSFRMNVACWVSPKQQRPPIKHAVWLSQNQPTNQQETHKWLIINKWCKQAVRSWRVTLTGVNIFKGAFLTHFLFWCLDDSSNSSVHKSICSWSDSSSSFIQPIPEQRQSSKCGGSSRCVSKCNHSTSFLVLVSKNVNSLFVLLLCYI